jgi:hypothetical protein
MLTHLPQHTPKSFIAYQCPTSEMNYITLVGMPVVRATLMPANPDASQLFQVSVLAGYTLLTQQNRVRLNFTKSLNQKKSKKKPI